MSENKEYDLRKRSYDLKKEHEKAQRLIVIILILGFVFFCCLF
jgi:hypothetical protein